MMVLCLSQKLRHRGDVKIAEPSSRQPFCDFLELELICTRLAYDEQGKCTGRLLGGNVKGRGKISALKKVVDLTEYDSVVAFGNSAEDRILATVSQHYHHRFFE